MQAQKFIAEGFLILSAIVLLAVLSWHGEKPARMRKPSAAVTKPAAKIPAVPQAPAAPVFPKTRAHPKVAVQAQAVAQVPANASDTHTRRIVVSLEDRRLAFIEDGQVKKIYAVAVGKDATPSPTGTFTIVKRVEDPTYYHNGKVVPPGSGNPVGSRWIGLSRVGYGIHGTNAPKSIGKAASHGCIRMARPDLEQLFAVVRTGDTVEIVGARDQETIALFGARVAPVSPAAAPAVLAQAAPQSASPVIDSATQTVASTAVVVAAPAAIPIGQ